MARQANGAGQEKDANIQVVVRCRDAPGRLAKSTATVITPPVYGQDVKIGGGAAGVSRSFHFDGVFGPKATQEDVYDNVVSPILQEVMQGYNCTIFAYGQTGTGKTHTMEGDLELAGGPVTPMVVRRQDADPLGTTRMSGQAGMIPRTLYNLFYQLNKQSAEFYVRVSYVELYNEELRDLLAGDNGGGGELRVFDSGTDKGVIIQGLEDKIVTSAREAIGLMQGGATRRRVAATRCNDTSSRSHAIFTVTVFIRERAVTVEGEDIVKLGKLNLVDLAGSENIGRSGAQDARAREAGNINKSLLVLGRVINALVEKNSYVPYRDSKLTYIIKDSLGGRTRTCMIATISNSAENVEETIKTLQYASQAKGIRNRPVANKKVSKSEIVQDMQVQLEQLRRDLDAAREGAGFYMTRESYDELAAQAKAAQEVAGEWKERVTLLEDEARRQARQCAAEAEAHAATRRALADRGRELDEARDALQAARDDARRQALLAEAHAFHEAALDGAAGALRGALAAAGGDVDALHAKAARLGAGERAALAAVASVRTLVARETQRAAEALAAHGARADAQAQRLAAALAARVGEPFERAVADRLQRHADAVRARVADAVAAAAAARDAAAADAAGCGEAITALIADLRRAVGDLARQGAGECAALVDGVRALAERQTAEFGAAAAAALELAARGTDAAAALLAGAQARARDAAAAHERETARLRAEHEREAAALAGRVRELAAEAAAADARLVDSLRDALAARRARSDEAAAAVLDAARAHAAAHAGHADRAAAQAAADRDSLDAAAGSALDGLRAAHAGADARLADAGAAAAEAAAALQTLAQDHVARLGARLDEIGPAAVERAQASAEAALGESRRAQAAAADAAAAAGAQLADAADGALRGAHDASAAAVLEWRAAREELDALALAQAAEQREDAAGLARGLSRLGSDVAEAAGAAQPTPATGATPPRRAPPPPVQWNRTRPHAFILAQADAHAGAPIGWTGAPAAADDEADSRMDLVSPAPSAASADPEPAQSRPESALLRKRPSDAAALPLLDAAAGRPARRARSEVPDVDLGDAPSAIPAPPSRLAAPRRTRRTRG
ncbi:hypothetical protein H4R18_002505 [Coemansia javaensis]|uniref:Kinesin motor domain-containing protein n=1 Tax=Coemansia javaensis TaxID=2761396 RepID=A0A9W8HEV1_9FUNG|nr:hypothetical protein H4R18_002505 [Coemansia javaensis]